MSPRPTPPSDADPEHPVEPSAESVHPDPAPPGAPDDTTVLPEPPAAAPVTAEDPAGWAQPAPGPPVATASYAAAGPPRPPQRWWGQATSTSGGRVALAVGALFTVAVLLAGAALVGGLVLRAVGGGTTTGWPSPTSGPASPTSAVRSVTSAATGRDVAGDAPGEQRRREMVPEGPQGRIVPPVVPDQGRGSERDGARMGGLGLGALGGDVLHGELTATVDGKPTVLVVQTGEVKTYTSGPSLVIRSSDGFEATYVLDGSVAATRGANGLATGAEVRVVAKKEGMSVMRLVVIT